MNLSDVKMIAAYAFLICFFWGLWMNYKFITRKDKASLAGIPTRSPWGIVDLVLVVLVYVELFLITGAALSFSKKDSFLILLLNCLIQLLTFIFMVYVLKYRHHIKLKDLGLEIPKSLDFFKRGFLAYIAALPPLLVLSLITKVFGEYFGIPLKAQIPLKMLMNEPSMIKILGMSLFIVLAAPFLEEVFFRGFLYPLIKKYLGFGRAMILSSLIFAVLHFSFIALLPVMCIGMFMAYIYEKTGSLFASIIFHSLNNLVAVLIVIFILK